MSTAKISRRHLCLSSLGAGAMVAIAPPFALARGTATPKDPWSTGPDLPIAVQEIYPAVWRGRVHLAGGFAAEDGRITSAVTGHWSWAPGESTWRTEPGLPEARHHPHLVGHEDTLFALGGFGTSTAPLAWEMRAQSWALTPGDDRWRAVTPAPEPHAEIVAATLGEHIHLVGGRGPTGDDNRRWTDHADTDRHLVFDPDADRWHRAAPLPTARNSAAGAVLNGQLHVVGGRTVGGGNLAVHEVYDPAADRWASAAPMPQAQGGLAAAALAGRLYAFGGEYFDDGGGVYPEVWVYDPDGDGWARGPDMPTPRHGLGAVALGDAIVTLGGASAAGGNGTSDRVEILRPSR